MYEINQELEELIKKLVKRIRRIKNKNPERIENIMRGVNLVMGEDIEYITKFFKDCELSMLPQSNPQIDYSNPWTISAPTTPAPNPWNTPYAYPSKEEMNIRYGMESMMQSEIQAQAAAAEFTQNVIKELGPGSIPPEKHMHVMGDVKEFITHGKFFEAREVIKGNWIPLTIPNPVASEQPPAPFATVITTGTDPALPVPPVVSSEVRAAMESITYPGEKPECGEEHVPTPKEEPVVVKKRKFVSDAEVEMISKAIGENPAMKSSEIIKILNAQGLIINPSVFSNIRNKVSSTRISDKYFTLGEDADGKRIIVPVVKKHEPVEREVYALTPEEKLEKLNQTIQQKLAQHDKLNPVEIEYMVKSVSTEIKSTKSAEVYSALKRKFVDVSFDAITRVLTGATNELPNMSCWEEESVEKAPNTDKQDH